MLDEGDATGANSSGNGERVLLEFVSANPTGPAARRPRPPGGVRRDTCGTDVGGGYAVSREYYVNDAGRQVDILTLVSWLRYLDTTAKSLRVPVQRLPGRLVRELARRSQRRKESLLSPRSPRCG